MSTVNDPISTVQKRFFPSTPGECLAAGYAHAEWVEMPDGKRYMSVCRRDPKQAWLDALRDARRILLRQQYVLPIDEGTSAISTKNEVEHAKN